MECNHLPPLACEITILLTDDVEIRALNRDYRKLDKATDVLSFSHVEEVRMGDRAGILGDIVISLDRVAVQAKRYRVSENRELLRLVIHGILHLFGYDHVGVSKLRAARMRSLETTLLKRYAAEFSPL